MEQDNDFTEKMIDALNAPINSTIGFHSCNAKQGFCLAMMKRRMPYDTNYEVAARCLCLQISNARQAGPSPDLPSAHKW